MDENILNQPAAAQAPIINSEVISPRRRNLKPLFIVALIILVAAGILAWRLPTLNPLRPAKIMAAEILRRNLTNFFAPGTIYHQKTQLYANGATTPIIYDLYRDQDSERFYNHVVYPDQEVWQSFDLDTRWDVNSQEKTIRKDLYVYPNPESRNRNLTQQADLAKQIDELLQKGVLEAKEGKLDNREVYVVYDTRNTPDKYWDVLVFDHTTFQLLKTEKYEGDGSQRHIASLIVYEIQESLPRSPENLNKFFQPKIDTQGYQIFERHFDVTKGYVENEYYDVSVNRGQVSTPSSDLLSSTPTPISNLKTFTNTKYRISFQYPQSAQIMGDLSGQLFSLISGNEVVSFLASNNPDGLSINDLFLKTISPSNPDSIRNYVSFSNVKFNNLDFVQVKQDPSYFNQQPASLKSYHIAKGNYVFSFGYNQDSGPLITQILSTFQFTQ